jgi:RimJ/RimL family protein N-acetyltransferase
MGYLAPRHFWTKDGLPFLVRTASQEDAAGCLEVARAVVREGFYSITTPDEFCIDEEDEQAWIARHTEDPDRLLLVAEVEGQVVGLLGLECGARQRLRHRATLHIAVAEGWRGRGVGTALMGCALDWAAAHPHIEKVSLAVLADNDRAIALYRRFGFQEEGRRPREVRRGPGAYVDDILMYRFVK